MALTVLINSNQDGVIRGASNMPMSSVSTGKILDVVSWTAANTNTNTQTLQAAKVGMNNYVGEQAAGGYRYMNMPVRTLYGLMKFWTGTSPYREAVSAVAGVVVPKFATVDKLFSLVSRYGMAVVDKHYEGKDINVGVPKR